MYTARIKSSLDDNGVMNYGATLIEGSAKTPKNYIISTYCCHPSMANDNVSGMILWAYLLDYVRSLDVRDNYYFVIAPETIGAIAFANFHMPEMRSMDAGLVITTVAGPGHITYKSSFKRCALDDIASVAAFHSGYFLHNEFDINGSDERQYSSPGLRIPCTTISKSQYFDYKQYHTSKDDLDFVSAENLLKTFDVYKEIIDTVNSNYLLRRPMPYGEMMAEKRGLYPDDGGLLREENNKFNAARWLLHLCDGDTDLWTISRETAIPFELLLTTADELIEHKMLEHV